METVHSSLVNNYRATCQGDEDANDMQIRWTLPEPGEVTLNCNGSVTRLRDVAACGGVVRDEVGNFIFAYAVKLLSCSVIAVELWGILHGVKIGWSRGFRRIRLCSDSKVALYLISKGVCTTHPCYYLISDILKVADDTGSIVWHHVLREANQVADGFAKFGLSLGTLRIFYVPPSFILNALRADAIGICFPRGF